MKTVFGHFNKDFTVETDLEVDVHTLPSHDPLAFGMGIASGQARLKLIQRKKTERIYAEPINHGSNHSELVPEYLRGFLFGYKNILVPEGTKIKKGQEQSYALLHLNTFKK